MKLRQKSLAILIGCGLFAAAPIASMAQDLGDYTALQQIIYAFSPPGADNPVTPAQRQGTYPLTENAAGFQDGFDPKVYDQWQTIQLGPETGAICGNGSPYKFFIMRSHASGNMSIYEEGGGACTDYATCTGGTLLSARNPNGIPDNYMSISDLSAYEVSPFVTRNNAIVDALELGIFLAAGATSYVSSVPTPTVKTQAWNLVYVPYCTGDIYSGDKVAVYNDPSGKNPPLVWHHNGLRNERAVVGWLKDHMPRPKQMLSVGCSAGGVGSLTSYGARRPDMAPNLSYLIDDSGPIFHAPLNGDPAQYPSIPLHTHIRAAWGLDAPNGPLAFMQQRLPQVDLNDMGSIYPALSAQFPGDHLGHTGFWQDLDFSAYSYEPYYPQIANAPDEATRDALLHQFWAIDTGHLRDQLSGQNNFGGYFPQYRSLNESHCSTIVDFNNGDIQEQNLQLVDFINSVLNENAGPVLHASELSPAADLAKPDNPAYDFVNTLLNN